MSKESNGVIYFHVPSIEQQKKNAIEEVTSSDYKLMRLIYVVKNGSKLFVLPKSNTFTTETNQSSTEIKCYRNLAFVTENKVSAPMLRNGGNLRELG